MIELSVYTRARNAADHAERVSHNLVGKYSEYRGDCVVKEMDRVTAASLLNECASLLRALIPRGPE